MSDSPEKTVPLVEALIKYKEKANVSFHVPGHKDGAGASELARRLLGEQVFRIDATEIPGLDNLNLPQGPIRDAEILASRLYGTRESMFLVNGSTAGVHGMILSTCSPGDEIIVSRNSHRSVIAGIILSGARPVYVQPEFHREFGIPLGVPSDRIRDTLDKYPDAVGVLVPNPNYYGITSDLKTISDMVHQRGKFLLVDEAFGGHFVFSREFPLSAIEAGADMCVQSMHKMAGSLTQSSILHVITHRIDTGKVRSVLAMLQTSSPSYILMASLDAARHQLEMEHDRLMSKIISLCRLLRAELKNIAGLTYTSDFLTGSIEKYRVDMTKVLISFRSLRIIGYEAGRILRDKCGIEVEYEDLYNILVSITFGNSENDIEHLASCLPKIIAMDRVSNEIFESCVPPAPPGIPDAAMTPKDAVWSRWRQVPLLEAVGEVCADIVSPYPPGVPIICPGEVVSEDIVAYLSLLIAEGAWIQGLTCSGKDHKDARVYMLRVVEF
jgi:arginine decarboxylase